MDLAQRAQEFAQLTLADPLPDRFRHVTAVAAEADRIAASVDDADGLIAAAWLHDVGYAPRVSATGFHALDGARFLRAAGWPARVCSLVAHHSCAAREAELRGLGDELAEFDDEGGPVRDALWYCDMTTGPMGERLNVADRLAEITERYGPDHVVTRFVAVARDELSGAVERTRERLRAVGLDQPM